MHHGSLRFADRLHLELLTSMLPPPRLVSMATSPAFSALMPPMDATHLAHEQPPLRYLLAGKESLFIAAQLIHDMCMTGRFYLPLTAVKMVTKPVKCELERALIYTGESLNGRVHTRKGTFSALQKIFHCVCTPRDHAQLALLKRHCNDFLALVNRPQEGGCPTSWIPSACLWAVKSIGNQLALVMDPIAAKVQRRWRQVASQKRLRELRQQKNDEQCPPFCMECGTGCSDDFNPLIICEGCVDDPSDLRRTFAGVHAECAGCAAPTHSSPPFFCKRFCHSLTKKEKRKAKASAVNKRRSEELHLPVPKLAEDLITIATNGGGAALSTDGDLMMADFGASSEATEIRKAMATIGNMTDAQIRSTKAGAASADRNLQIAGGVTATYDGEDRLHALTEGKCRQIPMQRAVRSPSGTSYELLLVPEEKHTPAVLKGVHMSKLTTNIHHSMVNCFARIRLMMPNQYKQQAQLLPQGLARSSLDSHVCR